LQEKKSLFTLFSPLKASMDIKAHLLFQKKFIDNYQGKENVGYGTVFSAVVMDWQVEHYRLPIKSKGRRDGRDMPYPPEYERAGKKFTSFRPLQRLLGRISGCIG